MKNKKNIFIILLLFVSALGFSQNPEGREGNPDNLPEHEYTLTLKEEMVNKAGKQVMGMTINGSIPEPTLEFNLGNRL